jgi:hypothetical protein
MTIRHIDVLSVAKIAAVIYAGLGFLVGLIFACVGLFTAAFGAMQNDGQLPAVFSMLFGVGAIIALPVIYGIMGFLVAAFTTWLFNIAAGIAGGVKIQIET